MNLDDPLAVLQSTSDFLLQVYVALNAIYGSGLNEYALYLDCEGGLQSHRGYDLAMSHLFKNRSNALQNLKVAPPPSAAVHSLSF